MFNFVGILFSLLKGTYNTCAIHTQVNRQASVARILFAGFFETFSSSINKILLDTQIKECNTKVSTRPNTYDESQNNTNTLCTAPHLPNLHHNYPLSLVSRNFKNLTITNPPNLRPNTIQSSLQHIVTQHSQNDHTYEQIIEQPNNTTFQTQNNHFFAHDEQTIWIPPSIKLPPSKPPKSNPHYPTFCFPPSDSPQVFTSSGRILILTQISQFFRQYHNLITI